MRDPHASDRTGILRNTALLGLSRVLDRISGFGVSLLIAPHLGAEGLGTYFGAIAVYSVIAIAGEAGTTNFLVREISRDPSRTSELVVHVSLVAIVISAGLMALALIVTPYLGYSEQLELAVSIVCLAILPTVLNSVQEAVFVAHGRVEFEAIANLLLSVTYIGLAALLLADGHGVASVLRVYVGLEYAVTIAYFVVINVAIARLRGPVSLPHSWRLAVEMRHFTASSGLAALFSRPEIVILSLLATEREIGYYGAAVRIAELPLFVPQVFMANVFPLLSRAYGTAEERFRELQATAVRLMLAFSLPLAALLLACAGGLVTLFYGDELEPAAPVLRILAANVVIFSLISVFWRSLAARGLQRTVLGVQASTIGLRLGGAIALIAPFDAIGAAVATVGGSAVQLGLLSRAATRSGAGVRVLGTAVRLAGCAAAGGAVAAVLGDVSVLVALCAGALVYGVATALTRALPPEDRERLRSLPGVRRLRRPRAAQGSSQ